MSLHVTKIGGMKWRRRRRLRVRISTVDSVPMQTTKCALLIALVFAGISCNTDRAKGEVLIKNDGGGDIPQYIAKYLYLQLSGERVVIDGASLHVRWRLVC